MPHPTNKDNTLRTGLRLSTPIVLLAVGVLGPVVLASATGIVAIALWESPKELVLGLLSLTLGLAALGTAIVVTVLLGKRSRLARMQSDLLASVSHELKTPLAGIRLHAQTLMQPEAASDPSIVAQCAQTIERETEWLSNTVDTLLTWRSSSRDNHRMSLQTGTLADLCELVANRFQRMLPPDGTRFDVSLQTREQVRYDSSALTSILMNLLTNAYKYSMPPRHIQFLVKDLPNQVLVRITDNGIGIAKEDQDKIFEPFYRVDNRLRAQASGAGLGLAIVAHLVHLHHGSVGVESRVGDGATFEVRFPIAASTSTPKRDGTGASP